MGYTGRAVNLEGEASCSAALNVFKDDSLQVKVEGGIQRPWFLGELQSAWAEVGNKATLEVQATGRPIPTFKWLKDNCNLDENDHRYHYFSDEQGNAKLVIRDCTEYDSGLYLCIADNKAGKAKCVGTLKVVPSGQLSHERRTSRETTPVGSSRRPPFSRETTPIQDLGPAPQKGTLPYFVQKPASEMVVPVGKTMTIKCAVDGDPKPYVTWMKGYRDLTYTEHIRVINTGNVYTLEIKSVLETDMGEYIAIAENPLGKIKSSCFVNIRPRGKDDSDDWEMRTYRVDLPDVTVEESTTSETANVAPSFTKKLPLETFLNEHENLEIKCKTKEGTPDVHVTKDYKFKVTGDLALEEKTINIHREEGEETAKVVGVKREVIMAGDKPSGNEASEVISEESVAPVVSNEAKTEPPNEPKAEPVSEVPMPEEELSPKTVEAESVKEETVVEPVKEEPQVEAVKEELPVALAKEEPVVEQVPDKEAPEPATEESVPIPVEEEVEEVHISRPVKEAPPKEEVVSEVADDEPVQTQLVSEIAKEKASEDPVKEEMVKEESIVKSSDVKEEAAAEPVKEQLAAEPVKEEPAAEQVEEPAAEPVKEVPAAEPVKEEPAAEPVKV